MEYSPDQQKIAAEYAFKGLIVKKLGEKNIGNVANDLERKKQLKEVLANVYDYVMESKTEGRANKAVVAEKALKSGFGSENMKNTILDEVAMIMDAPNTRKVSDSVKVDMAMKLVETRVKGFQESLKDAATARKRPEELAKLYPSGHPRNPEGKAAAPTEPNEDNKKIAGVRAKIENFPGRAA